MRAVEGNLGHPLQYWEEEREEEGATGHSRCSSAPGTRAIRRASFDGRSW